MPSVHIRDNLDLMPNAYRLTLMGVSLAEAEVYPDRELAINPGQVFGPLNGIAAKDPAFGLEAVWIEGSQRDQAQSLGYTVVDASTVIATHLNQVLYKHAHELLGHEEVQQLLQLLAKSSPKLAEELVPGMVSLSTLLKVLQTLLQEQVPVRDIRTIAEAIANVAGKSQDPAAMVAAVRVALSRAIVQNVVGLEPELPVITLEPRLEQILLNSLQKAGQVPKMASCWSREWPKSCNAPSWRPRSVKKCSASRRFSWWRVRFVRCSRASRGSRCRTCMCWPTRKFRTTSRSPSFRRWDRINRGCRPCRSNVSSPPICASP